VNKGGLEMEKCLGGGQTIIASISGKPSRLLPVADKQPSNSSVCSPADAKSTAKLHPESNLANASNALNNSISETL